MSFVLDASIALAWCFSDEATSTTNALLERTLKEKAFVPSHWSLEVGNILNSALRKKRILYAHAAEFLTLLQSLNIETDLNTSSRGFHEIYLLAHSENLTTYDAAYLELAMRLGLPLATKDTLLGKAAIQLGVKVLT